MTITLSTTELGKVISVEELNSIAVGLGIGLLVVMVVAGSTLVYTNNKKSKKKK